MVLDFRDVSLVGQAFADEIFRVYVLRQPDVAISAINTSEGVKKMVHRAMADRARNEERR